MANKTLVTVEEYFNRRYDGPDLNTWIAKSEEALGVYSALPRTSAPGGACSVGHQVNGVDEIGTWLKKLATADQVSCITHAAQIAPGSVEYPGVARNRPLAAFASSQLGRLTIGRSLPACPTLADLHAADWSYPWKWICTTVRLVLVTRYHSRRRIRNGSTP
jgi:hypothetical protein